MHETELQKFAAVARVDLFHWTPEGTMECLNGFPGENPVMQCESFREQLMSLASARDLPLILQDDFHVYFVCFSVGHDFYFIGPMSSVVQDSVSQRLFFRNYGISTGDAVLLRFFSLQEVLYITELTAELLTGKAFDETELLKSNHLAPIPETARAREQALYVLHEEDKNEEQETWRHSYRQERALHDAVAEGNEEEAVRLTRLMDLDTGRLSADEREHWKTLAIIGITVCSRAAIDGGLSPRTAYQLSGYYIVKCSACRSDAQILSLRDQAVRDLAAKVRENKERLHTASYTEKAKNYIAQNYREKMLLEDIAAAAGVSASYLSRIFRKDTGIHLQDYIIDIRIDRAANLLKYSDLPLSEIAAYVNFPSHSYFGKAFKAKYHMTPKEFRDRYTAAEWNTPDSRSV